MTSSRTTTSIYIAARVRANNLGSGNLEMGGIGERVGKGEVSLQAA